MVSSITTSIKNRNHHNTYDKENFSNSNHRIRKKTIANLSKQIITTDETTVFELKITFLPYSENVKFVLYKEQSANDFYIFIR